MLVRGNIVFLLFAVLVMQARGLEKKQLSDTGIKGTIATGQRFWKTSNGKLSTLEKKVADFENAMSWQSNKLGVPRVDHWNFVAPALKLGFCRISKIASMAFSDLFKSLNELDEPPDPFHYGLHWKDISNNATWKLAVFIRDPLERYLSAFISKCLPQPYGERTRALDERIGHKSARQCGHEVEWEVDTKAKAIEVFEQRALHDSAIGDLSKLSHDGKHWSPQLRLIQSCGMDPESHKDDYFIGQLVHDHNDVNLQVKSKLATVHAEDKNHLVDSKFPTTWINSHHSDYSEISVQDFYRNPSTIRAVLQLYEEDYRVLGLPLPAWVTAIDPSIKLF